MWLYNKNKILTENRIIYYKKLSANKYYEFCEIISQYIILKKFWNSNTFIIVYILMLCTLTYWSIWILTKNN